MKAKTNSVSVSYGKHNCGCNKFKKGQKYLLKCFRVDFSNSSLLNIFDVEESFSRYQIFHILPQLFSYNSRFSISRSFFSPFKGLNEFRSDLSYFFDILPLDDSYYPVAYEYNCETRCKYYYIAIKVF